MARPSRLSVETVLEVPETIMQTADDGRRKAAVFLKHLDAPTAESLLQQLPPQLAEQVRAALAQLESVDQEELDSIAEELLQGHRRVPDEVEDAVEINPSLVERLARGDEDSVDPAAEEPDAEPPPQSPETAFCRFLQTFTSDDLADFCSREHPQTASVILVHLPAERAAETLRRLPAGRQGPILRRMGHMGEIAPGVLEDIHQQMLETLPSRTAGTPPPSPPRLSNVAAILHALDDPQRRSLLESLRRSDQRMAESLGLDPPRPLPQMPEPVAFSLPAPEIDEDPGPSFQFDDLAALDDATLSKLIQYADPRIALLALSGGSPQLVDRLLGRLPLREARNLRRQLTEFPPTRLRDIELAQARLVALAIQLDRDGTIRLPSLRRFVSAA